jgi:hypothetical protein
MDMEDAETVPVLDLATVMASVRSQLTPRGRRAVWNKIVRQAAVSLPGSPAATEMRLDALRDVTRYLWSPSPRRSSRWDRPVIRVRRSLIQALQDDQGAAGWLSAALEQAAELPDEAGPLGRDAAVLVISGEILELAQAVADDPLQERQRLAELLLRSGRQSRNRDVAELTEFVEEQTERAQNPMVVSAHLPKLLRTDEIEIGPIESRIRDLMRTRVGGLAVGAGPLTGQSHRINTVHPLLTRTSGAHRDLLGLSLTAGESSDTPDWLGDMLRLALRSTGVSAGQNPAIEPAQPGEADRLNVGLVRADQPDRPVTGGSVALGTDHLVWVSIGPPDEQAVPDDLETVDLSGVADDDVLDVVVFPDPELTVAGAPYAGSFVMGQDRPLRVLRAVAQPGVAQAALASRLYFAVHTPLGTGSYDVRILAYHRNVLLQARKLTLPLGRARARLKVRTAYTVVSSLTGSSLRDLSVRRLSLYVNESNDGSHRLCFRGQDGNRQWESSAALPGETIGALINPIRAGLRQVSWQTEVQWQQGDGYRYGAIDGTRRFAPDLAQLELDLFELAARGHAAWEYLTSLFASPIEREQLRDRMRRPGIVEMTPAQGSRVFPPLAGLYDIGVDRDLKLSLCPDSKDALHDETDLADLACFEAGCPHAGPAVVCLSGFWGLRHEITVPTSLDRAADMQPRTFVGLPGLCASLIGTMPETVLEGVTTHASEVAKRFTQSKHVTSRGDWFKLAKNDSYDVLYFLCHGGEDSLGSSIILDGPNGQGGIHRADLDTYEVAFERHHPLVVLNACQTAALEPGKAITLVEGFTYYGASAVIGTEITIFPSLAYAFGTAFLDAFVTGRCHLGTAIRRARLDLLSKWNPLGLAYVAYGLYDLRLASQSEDQAAA